MMPNTHSAADTYGSTTSKCYSVDDSIILPWWEEVAKEVLRHSQIFNGIRLICELIQDPITAIEILSGRSERWLDSLLDFLCGGRHDLQHNDSTVVDKASQIVDILKLRPVPAVVWNLEWILQTIASPDDSTLIAERLDIDVWTSFCKIPFYSWVGHILGYKVAIVSEFLDEISSSCNHLIQYFQTLSQPEKDKLKSVEESLKDSHPLARWIMSHSLYDSDVPPNPSNALSFLYGPIRQLFSGNYPLIPALKRLAILAVRFKTKVVLGIDVDWHNPFSTEYSFLEAIERHTPENLAKSITNDFGKIFRQLSPADFLDSNSGHLKYIAVKGSSLCDDIEACLIVDSSLGLYMMRLAEEFISLWDYNSTAATGLGIHKGRFQLDEPTSTSRLINPENNFAALQALWIETGGLPYLPPLIYELQQSGNSSEQLCKIFRFVQYFGGQKAAGKKESVFEEECRETEVGFGFARYSPDQIENLTSLPQIEYSYAAGQLKHKAIEDIDIKEQQQYAPTTKRTRVDNNAPKRPRGRPRKVSSGPALEQKSRRSKTGCLTCRQRRKKCDERKPHCANCERLGFICEGFSKVWKWREESREYDISSTMVCETGEKSGNYDEGTSNEAHLKFILNPVISKD